jgi:carboxyl-terminal processing protease
MGLVALVAITAVVVFLAGFGAHWLLDHNNTSRASAPGAASIGDAQTGDLRVFWEAWHILQRDFYGDQPDAAQREHGAIDGLAQSYGDPYTRFVRPEPREREKEQLSGEFGGIGAWITKDDAGNLRLDPMPDRPAEKAGIRKDDILVAVAGAPVTAEMTADDAVALIRGPIGEAVELQVRREATPDLLTFEVVRERIETPSVEWRALDQNPQIGYIAIRQFTERTAGELDRALEELEQQDIAELVVDLRHNSGGLLQSAIDVTSRFLSDGVVLYERKSDGAEHTYRAADATRSPNWPIAVLVDGATASASEILAGALQDRGRARLVGEKTYGKGSVQLVYDLSDGSSIHVTVARWLTPNGHEINGVGLTPDVAVAHDDTRDAPLEEAIRLLGAAPAAAQ